MSGILRLENLNKGTTLKQGDKTVLSYRLSDADGEQLNVAGKTAVARLMHPDFTRIGYESEALTVSADNTVQFSIDSIIPSRLYYLEITVDGQYIFPSRSDEGKLSIDRSSMGAEITIIENAGIDAVVRKAVDLINEDPSLIIDEDKLVTDIIANTGIKNIEEYYQQYSDVIKELSENKDYHSLPEIAGARGGFDTLGDRLNDTTEQLAQKANDSEVRKKNESISLNDVDGEMLTAIEGGEGTEFNLLSIPRDGSVTPEKTTFLKGTNLFNGYSGKAVNLNKIIDGGTEKHRCVVISMEVGKTYDIKIEGAHNRFLIDVSDSLEVGTPAQRVSGWNGGRYTREHNSYTFVNDEGHKYMILTLGYITDSPGGVAILPEEYKANVYIYDQEYLTIDGRKIISEAELNSLSFTPNILIPSKNLLNKDKVMKNYSVSSSSGTVVALEGFSLSEMIPVSPNTTYTRTHGWSLAYYDANQFFISGVSGEQRLLTFTTPANCYFIRSSFHSTSTNVQIEKGEVSTDYVESPTIIDRKYLPDYAKGGGGFSVEFSTVKSPLRLDSRENQNLSLIALKSVQIDNMPPDYVGYLYLSVDKQSLFYSSGSMDRPEYLCDWDSSIVNGDKCELYQATITKDGDIIFMKNWSRGNPVIYPAGDYENPQLIDFGNDLKPLCWLTSVGVDHDPEGDFFIFGEYKNHSTGDEQRNDPRNIWKVSKPYNDPNNWEVKQSFKHVFFTSEVSDEPEIEIGHIHTTIRDFYTDRWYCSTGDIDRHCRVWESSDKGETWHEVAVDGQKWRSLGMIFTEDYAYWGTDSHYRHHQLYRVPRDEGTGVLNFDLTESIIPLDFDYYSGTQPTYNTVLLREPYGLLFLCRAEPRLDNMLDLIFYSFEHEKLYNVKTLNKIPDGQSLESDGRHGFGNQVVTIYQPTTSDGIITGGNVMLNNRPHTLDLVGNRVNNRVGNVKIKIREI